MSAVAITITNESSELARVSGLADQFAAANRLSADVAADLHVVLDEVLTNIIQYGYTDSRTHEISVQLSIEGGALVAEIEDDGVPFNPLESPAPDVTAPLKERRVGGLGTHFVKHLVNETSYNRIGGRNRLVLRRHLAG